MKNPFPGLFRARDKPARRASPRDAVSAAPGFYYGASLSGKSVTPTSAIQVSAVYACVRVIAETVASLPLHVYEATDSGSRKAGEHPLYRLLHDEPNAEMTSFVWRETMLSHRTCCSTATAIARSSVRAAAGSWGCIRFCPTA